MNVLSNASSLVLCKSNMHADLLPFYRHCTARHVFRFLCLLHQCAERTAAHGEQIVYSGSVDALSLADSSSVVHVYHPVEYWHEEQTAMKAATFTCCFSILQQIV